MKRSTDIAAEEVTPLAARMGRITLFVIGTMFLVPSLLYWHFSDGGQPLLVLACVGAGLVHLGIGLLGSDKFAAHFGFWAPTFRP